jgi:mRNA interferase MazF
LSEILTFLYRDFIAHLYAMGMEYEYIKDFDAWNVRKKKINKDPSVAFIQTGAIWLTSIGVNIGSEIDGKDDDFARPVVIVKKVSPNIFIGVPATSKIVEMPYRSPITILGRSGQAVCSHIKSLDRKRLIRYVGKIDQQDFKNIMEILAGMFSYPKVETPASPYGGAGESRLPHGDGDTIVADDELNAS